MRGGITVAAIVSLLTAGMFAAGPATAAATALRPGGRLHVGDALTSANGRFEAVLRSGGRLVVRERASGRQLWATPSAGPHASLTLNRRGQVTLRTERGVAVWQSRTRGSGGRRLAVSDRGALVLTASRLLVWSNRVGSRCPDATGKAVIVDLGDQRARMCRNGQQIRTTAVTTGASALGNGTPTGTWHVYARVRDTTLYPAAGGAYPVHYWMPYDGPYGMHDSPWQTFAYGSSLYKTRGSHGCTHVPGPMMAWLFSWASVGTRVVVHG
jgi:hypothetical protein